MNQVLEKLPLILYIGINNLFLYKYGVRQDFINVFFLIPAFNILLFFIYLFFKKTTLKDSFYTISFLFISVVFFISTIIVNQLIDGESLNIDRWSAMSVSINAVLENRYPYSELDHLNQHSSNFPSLLLIGLPFYLLGDIGYLQSFCFLVFSYIIYKTIATPKAKLFGLLLLIFSIFYLWEIYVKSDLMSNFILILGFIIFYGKQKEIFKNPMLLGSISGFLFFTRVVSIIPLSILLFNSFLKTTSIKKVLYAISAFLTLILLTYFAFRNFRNLDIVREFNPLNLQNKSSQLPMFLSIITILIPFYFSTKTKSINDIIKFCVYFLSIPIIISFIIKLFTNGISDIIYKSSFDISYFNIITPFIIYYIIMEYDKKQIEIKCRFNKTTLN